MALGTFAPGEYTMTYNGNACGLCTSGGQNLRFSTSEKAINNTSTYGDTRIDGIFRGFGKVQLMVTFKEWTSTIKSIIWPWSVPATPVFDGKHGLVGQLSSDAAKAIVLTAVTNTPAATNGPATLTASKAILAPENDINILFAPDERDVAVLFNLLLYDDTGVKRFFTLT